MNKKKISKIILYLILIALGVLMFVYAEYDDSPGGQLIGVLVVIGSIVGMIKTNKN